MSTIARKTHQAATTPFRLIIVFSAWGFALVLTSLLFLWLGYLLDELLGSSPTFMLGLFILAVIGCFIELYQEIMKILKHS